MVEEREDFEIEDVENWRGTEDNRFSHQTLVMKALDTCLTNGSVEMKEGFWNNKIDKQGNVIKLYQEDTRKKFIESVKTLLMLTHRDWKDDEDYSTKIEIKKKLLFNRKNFWLGEEWKWWKSLSPLQKQQLIKEGKGVSQGMFNKNNDFDNYFHDEELDIYRELCSLVGDFIKDVMKDFEGEVWIG